MYKQLALSAAAAFMMTNCALAQEPASVSDRGAELLAPFKRDLMQALTAGMAEGPVAAIEVCQIEAPGIAASLSQEGVRVGRSSHRLRNPDNAPPDWLQPIMDAYLDDTESRMPRSVSLADGRTGYAEPILLQPLCLTCHGSELPGEVARRIEELYPEDRATGFEVGELRGVFWAEFSSEP